MKKLIFIILCLFCSLNLYSQKLLIFMDEMQTDHLKAYGVVYWALTQGERAEWLLNYRSGSFLIDDSQESREKANLMGVSFQPLDSDQLTSIYQQIEENNMNQIFLDKAPRVAVYAPSFAEPWDDAVRLALEYASIPYKRLWDEEVLLGELEQYDWLHLHHEDFTGQYGKFYASYRKTQWYQKQVSLFTKMARELGYKSVQSEKCAVAKMIQAYVSAGGFLFAMCAACDTIDIALSAENIDIVPQEIDGTGFDSDAQKKLDFTKCFAFENFQLIFDPFVYEFSDIDINIMQEGLYYKPDTFSLFDFSAKEDPVPCMLTQNHKNVIKGFLGQTTAFNRKVIKDSVTILGETKDTDRVRYIHGEFGKGTYTFLGGHDPEDYRHLVGDPPTDLSLHKNSAGYRLILNNVLFPAAHKKRRKT